MEIDRQIEYDIRNFISDLNDKEINKRIKDLLKKEFFNFSKYELLCYSLIAIENEFKLDTYREGSMHQNAANSRVILEWFLKFLLTHKIRKTKFIYDENKYKKFNNCIPTLTSICVNYLINEKFKQKRGINKIKIEINEKGEYYFINPTIYDKVDCQDTYFYERYLDKEEVRNEELVKGLAVVKIFEKYFSGKSEIKIADFFSLNTIDNEIYSLCKENIRVDIDKMGCGFESKIFSDKENIINILGAFMYISKLFIIENDMKSVIPAKIVLFEEPIVISKHKLVKIIKKFVCMQEEDIDIIINYFTINNDLKWGMNEYPLINIDEFILWIPSSFIANDFQFSIVNGHYEKQITIINKDKTVSQSVVDKIVLECSKYSNIIVTSEKEYFDKNNLFNGKELKSDIDIALYDSISNTVLIIECKWKEKLYIKGEKYDKICDDINKIFSNQLEKHKCFLSLDINNIDLIFNNSESVKNRPYYPIKIQYIMVDKRIQLHYDGKHTLSEFNFLKIIKENSINNILKLENVISYINTLNTEVKYSVGKSKSIIEYGNKRINNSLFDLI